MTDNYSVFYLVILLISGVNKILDLPEIRTDLFVHDKHEKFDTSTKFVTFGHCHVFDTLTFRFTYIWFGFGVVMIFFKMFLELIEQQSVGLKALDYCETHKQERHSQVIKTFFEC